jgi:flagellar basal body rod protein FlgG
MVEQSNTDPVEEAVNLIGIQRSFESYLEFWTPLDSDRKVQDIGNA